MQVRPTWSTEARVVVLPPLMGRSSHVNTFYVPSTKSSSLIPMPAEQPIIPVIEQHHQEPPQTQVKHCTSCRCPLTAESATSTFLDHNDSANVCATCRAQGRTGPANPYSPYEQFDTQNVRRTAYIDQAHVPVLSSRNEAFIDEPAASRNHMDVDDDLQPLESSQPATTASHQHALVPSQSQRAPLRIVCETEVQEPLPVVASRPSSLYTRTASSPSRAQSCSQAVSCPDPLVDITRIRIRSRGHHCLYPGASFQGTQKSGRNSYDVNVTIVVCPPYSF